MSNLRKFLLTLYRPHLWPDFYETWSECLSWQCLGQVRIWVMKGKQIGSNLRKFLLTLYRPHLWPDFYETWSECLSWQCLGQVRIWVMKGKQTRSNLGQLLCILVSKAKAFKFGPLVHLSLWNWTLTFYNIKLDPLINFYILKLKPSDLDLPGVACCT